MKRRRLRAVLRGAIIAASAAPSVLVAGLGCGGATGEASAFDAGPSREDGAADAPGADASPDVGPRPSCSSSGFDAAGAPVFDAADPWDDAPFCDGPLVLPPNPYTCCGASYFVPTTCVPPPLVTVAPDGAVEGDGGLDCVKLCGAAAGECSLVLSADAQTGVGCQNYGCLGRRPQGLVEDTTGGGDIASFLCRAHLLEAASVTAFRTLRAELKAHGAPRSLLRAASRATRDEKRHARVTKRLARNFGGAPSGPTIAAAKARDLEAIATENAVEGCVRELYGAAVARWQAANAEGAAVRAAMAELAEDELRHAALALRVAAWLHPRLSRDARRRVEAERARAVEELSTAVEQAAPEDAARTLGLPSPGQARTILDGLRPVWARA